MGGRHGLCAGGYLMEVHWKRLLETCCSWEMGIQYTTSSRGVVIMVVLDNILGGLQTSCQVGWGIGVRHQPISVNHQWNALPFAGSGAEQKI